MNVVRPILSGASGASAGQAVGARLVGKTWAIAATTGIATGLASFVQDAPVKHATLSGALAGVGFALGKIATEKTNTSPKNLGLVNLGLCLGGAVLGEFLADKLVFQG